MKTFLTDSFLNCCLHWMLILRLTLSVYPWGAIAVIFAAGHSELVKKLVLIDPAGYPVHIPLPGRIARTPAVGDYIMQVLGNRFMVKEANDNFHRYDKLGEFMKGGLRLRWYTGDTNGPF